MGTRHLSLMVIEDESTQDTLWGLGWGIDFKPRQETMFEEIALMLLPLSTITLQSLVPLLT